MTSEGFDTLRTLESDIKKSAVPSKPLPPALEQRRLELLTSYLGYEPSQPLPVLYVVGDSHVGFFAGTENMAFHKGRRILTGFFRPRYIDVCTELLPVFRVFHLGPATAWNAGCDGSTTYAFEKLKLLLHKRDIPPGGSILLVFGEIDIRCHIPRAFLSGGKSLDEFVVATVERFLKLPLFLKDTGYVPALWLPTLTAKLPPTGDMEDIAAFPAVGSQELRDEIARLYCDTLRKQAASHGLKSCGLDPDLPVPDDQRYLDDQAHLSQLLMPHALAAMVKKNILPLIRPGK